MAPTVSLCVQQHEVISAQLPAIQTRKLTGADQVDRWGSQLIWDSALKGVRVVISTHAVLCDALTHGFVRMEQLALIVFDEGERSLKKTGFRHTDEQLIIVPNAILVIGLCVISIIPCTWRSNMCRIF